MFYKITCVYKLTECWQMLDKLWGSPMLDILITVLPTSKVI